MGSTIHKGHNLAKSSTFQLKFAPEPPNPYCCMDDPTAEEPEPFVPTFAPEPPNPYCCMDDPTAHLSKSSEKKPIEKKPSKKLKKYAEQTDKMLQGFILGS